MIAAVSVKQRQGDDERMERKDAEHRVGCQPLVTPACSTYASKNEAEPPSACECADHSSACDGMTALGIVLQY